MHFLDDKLRQVIERVLQIVRLAQHVGRHVVQQGFLTEIEADHLGHIGIDRLVVGDAGANGIGQRHATGAIGREQAGNAEHRILAENQRIEEIVVEAAIDHVNALRSARRAHEDRVVLDEQIAPFDKFDAHLLRQEGVFEIGAVVGTGRQQNDRRIVDAGRRDGTQVLQQHVGIMLHRRDLVLREQFRKEPHRHLAVLDHVRHARGHPQVVLQHVILAALAVTVGTHHIHAGDVRIDAGGHIDADHFGAKLGVVDDLFARDTPRTQDFLGVIDIVQKGVERLDALPQAGLQAAPFLCRNDARNDVEGNQALLACFLAIHRKGDADAAEGNIGLGPLARDALRRRRREPVGVGTIM